MKQKIELEYAKIYWYDEFLGIGKVILPNGEKACFHCSVITGETPKSRQKAFVQVTGAKDHLYLLYCDSKESNR